MVTFAKFTTLQGRFAGVIERKRNCGCDGWLRILSDCIFYSDASTHLAKNSKTVQRVKWPTVQDGCYMAIKLYSLYYSPKSNGES